MTARHVCVSDNGPYVNVFEIVRFFDTLQAPTKSLGNRPQLAGQLARAVGLTGQGKPTVGAFIVLVIFLGEQFLTLRTGRNLET